MTFGDYPPYFFWYDQHGSIRVNLETRLRDGAAARGSAIGRLLLKQPVHARAFFQCFGPNGLISLTVLWPATPKGVSGITGGTGVIVTIVPSQRRVFKIAQIFSNIFFVLWFGVFNPTKKTKAIIYTENA